MAVCVASSLFYQGKVLDVRFNRRFVPITKLKLTILALFSVNMLKREERKKENKVAAAKRVRMQHEVRGIHDREKHVWLMMNYLSRVFCIATPPFDHVPTKWGCMYTCILRSNWRPHLCTGRGGKKGERASRKGRVCAECIGSS